MGDGSIRSMAAELESLSGTTTFEAFLGRVLQLVPNRTAAFRVAAELERRAEGPHTDAAIAGRRLRLALLAGLYPAVAVSA
jgi:hypothetical protein